MSHTAFEKGRIVMLRTKGSLLVLVLTLTGLLPLLACQQEGVAEVSIGANEFAFAAPDNVGRGLTRVTLDNTGKEDHQAQFFRLNEGVTPQQFQEALQAALRAVPTEGEGAALGRLLALGSFAGGPNTMPPGEKTSVVQDLQPGQYMVLCFVPSPDGVPHLAKGMIRPLTVGTAPSDRPTGPKPEGTSLVELTDFTFVLPEWTAGKNTVEVVNKGKEPHELTIVRAKGVPASALRDIFLAPPGAPALSGPPLFESAGGIGAIAPGSFGWAEVDLPAGDYALLRFVPSPVNQGKPHVALGMFQTFTVK